jgi:hypothetical protein
LFHNDIDLIHNDRWGKKIAFLQHSLNQTGTILTVDHRALPSKRSKNFFYQIRIYYQKVSQDEEQWWGALRQEFNAEQSNGYGIKRCEKIEKEISNANETSTKIHPTQQKEKKKNNNTKRNKRKKN